MEGAWNTQQGNKNKYQYNGIEHIDEVGLSFSMYRIHDPALGRWMQVDPLAELGYHMSSFNSMQNNPILYADPDGDWVIHAGSAVLGAGYNIYNNWDSVVKNPWSAIGYGATGAVAGAVSVSAPGAARAILAVGNVATDIGFGNIPDFNGVGDVASYAGKLTMDAIAVGGSGAIVKSGLKSLAGAGSEVALDILMNSSPEVLKGLYISGTMTDQLGNVVLNIWSQTQGLTAQAAVGVGAGAGGVFISSALHGNSARSQRPTQVYEHWFENSEGKFKTYTGVGGTDGKRAKTSLKQWEKTAGKEGYTYSRSTKVNVANRKIGYGVEQTRIDIRGGAKSSLNYNRINSPGKKLLRLIRTAL